MRDVVASLFVLEQGKTRYRSTALRFAGLREIKEGLVTTGLRLSDKIWSRGL